MRRFCSPIRFSTLGVCRGGGGVGVAAGETAGDAPVGVPVGEAGGVAPGMLVGVGLSGPYSFSLTAGDADAVLVAGVFCSPPEGVGVGASAVKAVDAGAGLEPAFSDG